MKTISLMFLLTAGVAQCAEMTPYAAGYRVGYWVVPIGVSLALLMGIAKCFVIARRPSASAKALWALILVLVILAWALIMSALERLAGPMLAPTLVLLNGLMGLGMFAVMVTSIVLGILGLIECINRKEIYSQGKGQAITVLTINGLFLLLIVCAVAAKLMNSGANRGSLQRSLEYQRFEVTFTNFNFRLLTPGSPWVEWNVQKLNPASQYGMMRSMPGMFFSIVPETLGPDTLFTAESYAEIVKNGLASRAEAVRSLGERHVVRRGLDGLEIKTEAQLAGHTYHYVHRIILTNGFAYQLMLWGQSNDAALIRSEAERVFEGFSLLDTQRIGGLKKAPVYESAAHHFAVSLPGGWFASLTKEKDLPDADFMASHMTGTPFAVVPLDLRGETIPDDALISALLDAMSFKYPSDEIVAESRTPHQWGTIFRLECQRAVSGHDFDYSLMIVRGSRYAYLLAAWSSSSRTNAAPVREEAFASFRPLPVPEEPEPIARLSALGRTSQAGFWNRLGLYYHQQGDFQKSARFFALASEHNPEVGVFLANQIEALANLGKDEEALRILEQRLPAIKAPSGALMARQAALQEKAGRTEQALETYAKVFENGYRNELAFTAYLTLLASEEKLDRALGEVDKYLAKGDSLEVRLSQAMLLRRKKEFAKSIDLLKTAQAHWTTSSELTLSLGESLVQSGAHQQATEVVQELLRGRYDSPSVFYLKGRAEVGLKNYREAKASFEKALDKAPGSPDIRTWLAQVSGLLGEGSNTDIKQPIAPVDIPKKLLESSRSVAAGEAAHGAKFSKRLVAHSFRAGERFKTTEYELIHVYDRSGVAEFSTLQFSFDPLFESIYVNSLKVKDTNGAVAATGNVSDYYVLDDAAARTISQRKVLYLPVPSLQPGREIEVMMTRRTFGSVTNFPYREHFFSATVPVSESTLLVQGDARKIRFKSSTSLQPEKLDEGLCWKVSNPPIVRWEPLQPDVSKFLPIVRLGDAEVTWDAEAAEYQALIQSRLEIPDSVRQLSSNLVERLTNSEAKVAVLSRFVQSNLTYKPIEFGRRALVPQRASDILANRYGDCKDHSLLLWQLAEAAGIPARIALVSSRRALEKDLPSLDQFDHVITYLPNVREGLFVDCTDKGSDLTGGVPLGLGNREAFVLEEKRARFISIPPARSVTSHIHSDRTVRFTNNADLAVAEMLKLTGPIAGVLRSWLRETEPSARIRALQSQISGEAELDKLEVSNLDRTDEPLELRLVYSLRRQMQTLGNRLVGQIPCLFERTYLALSPLGSRLTPFELTIPVTFQSHVQFDAPDGYAFSPLKTPESRLPERFARCETSILSQGQHVELRWKAERQVGSFASAEYERFKSALDNAIGELAQTIVLSKSPL